MPLAFRKRLNEQGCESIQGIAHIKEAVQKGELVLMEPDGSVRDALSFLLREKGWKVRLVGDCGQLRLAIEAGGLTAVISESTLPDCAPEEILQLCSKFSLPVVFTGHDLPLQEAVDLIRQGAIDFLDKPFPQSRLLDLLDRLANRQNGESISQSA